jgi:alkenylglycerophosphocholine hydrolase
MKKAGHILFLLSAIVFITADSFDYRIITDITKPIPLIILILLVSRNVIYNKLIMIGLIFSMFGDILLKDSFNLFVSGLISFLVAHVFYIFAFLKKDNRSKLISCLPFYLYGALFFLFLRNYLGDMSIPVLFYMLIITTMLWRSFVQRNSDNESKWAFYGAILFTISDSMIAFAKFYEPFFLSSFFIMLTYWGGQFLIYRSTTNPDSVTNAVRD